MKDKQKKMLKRSLKRNIGRIFLGKENAEKMFMDRKIRETFPDKQKRIEYINSLIDFMGKEK